MKAPRPTSRAASRSPKASPSSKTSSVSRTSKPKTLDGLPIVDASRPLLVHVTPGDVKPRGRRDPGGCVAARAINRECGVEARVHLSRVYVRDSIQSQWIRYEAPKALRTELITFDRGAGFEPGEYELLPPSESHRSGAKGPGGGRRTSGQRTPRPRHMVAGVRNIADVR